MKKSIVLIASLFFSIALMSQSEMDVVLTTVAQKTGNYCVQLNVINSGNMPMKVRGQNIRLFYDSKKLAYKDVFLDGFLPVGAYDLDLKTEAKGLSKPSSSQLDFNSDMGFLNYAITAKDIKDDQGIIEAGQSLHGQTICFNQIEPDVSLQSIALARQGVTDSYSNAYSVTTASVINEEILLPIDLADILQSADLAGLE